ncbi:MAG: efflux RND transporter periplasmic adaptor subunit [Anaerolineales bacterium]|nr:efflux RND transporter periplasmic adaptor subunit [Anaerolineales bacterium]
MHPNPRRLLPVVAVVVIAALLWWFLANRPAAADTGALGASGTIEAVSITIAPEIGGRVVAVLVSEGQVVQAGEVLVRFDDTVLSAQRDQAAAGLTALQAAQNAAEAARDAAAANFELLEAGPSDEQLAVAQTVVDRAQLAADAAREAYAALPDAALDTPDGRSLAAARDQAVAALANAEAQYDLLAAGARAEQLQAAEAQSSAARYQAEAAGAQVAASEAALAVLDAQLAKLTLTAPAEGTVLARSIEPGEFAAPGAALLVLGQLSTPTITVYIPEDQYGGIRLGQTARVMVDSFPGQTFTATVTHIADQAEFTPRNVQTAEGRKSTVFAIKLAVDNPDGRLKPGMPADVEFGE